MFNGVIRVCESRARTRRCSPPAVADRSEEGQQLTAMTGERPEDVERHFRAPWCTKSLYAAYKTCSKQQHNIFLFQHQNNITTEDYANG